MLSLRDYIGQQLEWVRHRHIKNSYELRSGDQVLATLRYQDASHSIAEAGDQQWIFKREGPFHANIVVYPASTQQDAAQSLASIKRNWKSTGQLLFVDGHTFNWCLVGMWRPTYSWTTSEGSTVLRLKKSRQLLIEPSASDLPDLVLLVLLGFYLVLVAAEDAAVDAALIAATTIT